MHLITGEFIGVLYIALRKLPYHEVKDLIDELKSLKQIPDELLEKPEIEKDGDTEIKPK